MNKTLTILVCIMVAGVVVGASLPIFDSLTASSESVHNDGAGWVRFALDRNADTTYSLSYTEDENGFYIDNGTDRQTYDDSSTVDFNTILYADSNLSVWHDGTMHILGTNEGNPIYLEGSGAVTIVRDAEGVTVTSDGSDPVTFGVPTWSYIPVSTGNYGFFLAADFDSELGNGVKNYPSDMPLAVVGGGNVGVYAYNNIYTYNGLGLVMNPIYDDDGLFYGGYWDRTVAPVESLTLDPLDPSAIDLDPIDIDLDPIVLDPGAELMSLPTPTYTDGDWGFDVISGTTNAKIVSYSGGAGNIVIPSTVSSGGVTYTVTQIGKDTYNEVFDNSTITGSTIEIPDTVTYIATYAFNNCSGFTGALVIPASVKSIGQSTFQGCTGFTSIEIKGVETLEKANTFQGCTGLKGDLILPDTLTTLSGSYMFGGCTGLTGTLVIPNSVTTLGGRAFQSSTFEKVIIASDGIPNSNNPLFLQMTSVPEVLDLSETVDYSVTRSGLPSTATIYDSIGDCFGFVSVVDYHTPGGGSPTQQIIAMLPLVMVLGLVLVAVGIFIWNRM